MTRIAPAAGTATALPFAQRILSRRTQRQSLTWGLSPAALRDLSLRPSTTALRASVFSSAVEESEMPENVSNTAWWQGVSVGEVMTPNPVAVSPDTSIFTALELLTERRVSGLAVVEGGEVVGVVSSFDILVLDVTPGQLDKSDGFFPPIGRCREDFNGDPKAMWRSFLSLRNGINRAQASKVGDSMHDTYTVSVNDTLPFAADILVRKNAHRAFVLDEEGVLCGVITRGDILRKTMEKYREIRQKTP